MRVRYKKPKFCEYCKAELIPVNKTFPPIPPYDAMTGENKPNIIHEYLQCPRYSVDAMYQHSRFIHFGNYDDWADF